MFINNLGIYKIIFIIELLVVEFLFTFRLERREHYVLRCIFSATFCVLVAIFFPILYYNSIYFSFTFICLFAVTIAALVVCYKESVLHVIYVAVAAYTVRHLAFQLFSFLITLIEGTNTAVNGIYGNDSLQNMVFDANFFFSVLIFLDCYYGVYALAYFLFGRKLNSMEQLKLKKTYLLGLIVIILLVDIILNSIFVYNEEGNNFTTALIVYVYNILCCYLVLFMQSSMLDIKKLKDELATIDYLWHQERKQYEMSKENIELINLKCHNLRYQIRSIQKTGEIDGKTIDEIENMISIYDSTVKTNNEELDIILTEKSLICHKNNIKLTCMVDGEKLTFMDKTDIYVLFGNLVDNAIEAVTNLKDVNRRVIGLNIFARKKMLAINVNNYYGGELILDEKGMPITTKSDKISHGYGMKSIRMIVEKYNGDINVTAQNSVFNVSILLPIVKEG